MDSLIQRVTRLWLRHWL